MALTIRMRIDDNDEHSYYYATGSGEEIELIPLVVDENGVFVPDQGKAYNRVTVNVPETDLETLIVDANGTYNAPDGKAYNVVTVNVQQIINLQNKSASYTANGNYTIQADSGYDGLGTVSVAVAVPTPSPRLQSKSVSYDTNGTYSVVPSSGYDGLSSVSVEVDVQGGGGTGSVDCEHVDVSSLGSGVQNLIELRPNETVVGVYIFNESPDMAGIPDVNTLVQFSGCKNSMGSSDYDMCVNVETDDGTAQHTTTNATALALDMVSPSSSSDVDIIGVANGYLQGYVLDPANDIGGYGLIGVYYIAVVYETVL